MMRDVDVRATLRTCLRQWHGEEPNTRIVEEFGLFHGDVRVDLVAIERCLHGYEIKSDSDTLARLPSQAKHYSQVLDRITLVVGERHHSKAKRVVPEWWGVKTAVPVRPGLVRLYEDRASLPNPQIDARAVASLLWREEAFELLERMDAAQGLAGKPRTFLFYRLSQVFALPDLQDQVRQILKARTDWKWSAELEAE